MKTVLVADMHLKPGAQPVQNRALREFLRGISGAARLVLLGDTFNGWFERRRRTVGDFSEVLNIFREAAGAGLEINHICGNRDFAVARGLPDARGWRYDGFFSGLRDGGGVSVLARHGLILRGMSLRIRQDGLLLHCTHGDQLCLGDWGHQMLRWWLMSLGPRLGAGVCPFPLFDAVVGFAQYRDVVPHFGIIPFAKNISDAVLHPLIDSGVDFVFCGHFHRNERRMIETGRRRGELAIIKCWSNSGCYGIFEDAQLRLCGE